MNGNWTTNINEATSRLRKYFKIPIGQSIPIKLVDDELLRIKEQREKPGLEDKTESPFASRLLDDLVLYKQAMGYSMFRKSSALYGLEKRQLQKRG